jgi:hypothetical protein
MLFSLSCFLNDDDINIQILLPVMQAIHFESIQSRLRFFQILLSLGTHIKNGTIIVRAEHILMQ